MVQLNQLPEYELSLGRNGEGEEVVRFVHRTLLSADHPRREFPRPPTRRLGQGIYAKAATLGGSGTGD